MKRVSRLREDFEFRKAEILGKKSPVVVDEIPLWAEAMEAQKRAKQAKFREQFRQRIEAKRIARTEEFHKTIEHRLTQKTPGKLGRAERLDSADALDVSSALDHTGPISGR